MESIRCVLFSFVSGPIANFLPSLLLLFSSLLLLFFYFFQIFLQQPTLATPAWSIVGPRRKLNQNVPIVTVTCVTAKPVCARLGKYIAMLFHLKNGNTHEQNGKEKLLNAKLTVVLLPRLLLLPLVMWHCLVLLLVAHANAHIPVRRH